jgi:hypothetical protein
MSKKKESSGCSGLGGQPAAAAGSRWCSVVVDGGAAAGQDNKITPPTHKLTNSTNQPDQPPQYFMIKLPLPEVTEVLTPRRLSDIWRLAGRGEAADGLAGLG